MSLLPIALMRTSFWCLFPVVFALIAPSAGAQYRVAWFAVGGGGAGSSTAGGYSLNGTIGQPAAGGPMTNGAYSVVGGFWALPIAVQTAGAPTLAILPGGPGEAVISWTPATAGYVLQETPTLSPPDWRTAPSGGTNPVVVIPGAGGRFYRLFKP